MIYTHTYSVLGGTVNLINTAGKLVITLSDAGISWAVGTSKTIFGQSHRLSLDAFGYGITGPDGNLLRATQLLEDADNILIQLKKDAQEVVAVVKKIKTYEELWSLYPNLKVIYEGLPEIAKANLGELTPNTLKTTLLKLESNAELLAILKEEPILTRLWTAHKNNFSVLELKEAQESFAELAKDLSDNARTLALDLAEESGKKGSMMEVFGLGNRLGENIIASLSSKSGHLFEGLAQKLGMTVEELKGYELVTEVPLKTANGFMKADVLLIKRGGTANKVQDVILIENKLSANTAFTTRQIEGWRKIAQKQSMDIIYDRLPQIIVKDGPITISPSKTFKFSDSGTDNISNVTIDLIDVTKF